MVEGRIYEFLELFLTNLENDAMPRWTRSFSAARYLSRRLMQFNPSGRARRGLHRHPAVGPPAAEAGTRNRTGDAGSVGGRLACPQPVPPRHPHQPAPAPIGGRTGRQQPAVDGDGVGQPPLPGVELGHGLRPEHLRRWALGGDVVARLDQHRVIYLHRAHHVKSPIGVS